MNPPPRPAHLFATEDGLSREAAQWGLLMRLSSFADIAFTGDANGRIAAAVEESPELLRFDIDCDLGFAQLELSLAADGWVKAELFCNARVVFRAWIEDPYEEKEGWPDGAEGVGEAPLRVSKRGGWLDIDAKAFPGVPAGEHGRFQIQDATG